MALAFAISIALHEIVAGAIPPNRPQSVTREIVSSARLVRITRRAIRPPSATFTPQPNVTPPPVPAPQRQRTVAPVARIAAQTPHHVQVHRPVSHLARNARPVWDISAGPPQNGALTASAGKTKSAGAAGESPGNGAAAPSGEQPCGFVTFSDPHGSHFDAQTHGFWVDIRMSVHFADGSAQSVILDYPWYYPSEAANPWSDANLRDPSFPTRFQPPPPNKIGSEPALVQYVVAHSTPSGMTLLRDCPAPAAASR